MSKNLPKFWHDNAGTVRLITVRPIEGWLLARRPGAAAFAVLATDLRKLFEEGRHPKDLTTPSP